ncbi:hypothetical protein V8E36_008613 [Tilletia maclaganii]
MCLAHYAPPSEPLPSRSYPSLDLTRYETGNTSTDIRAFTLLDGSLGLTCNCGSATPELRETITVTSPVHAGGSSESSEDDEEADTEAGSGASSGKRRARKGTEDGVEEGDDLFDIEDVLFNLPMSPQSVPGRPATLLFNETLNVDQLRKMGFFREQLNSSTCSATDSSPGNDADLLNSGTKQLARMVVHYHHWARVGCLWRSASQLSSYLQHVHSRVRNALMAHLNANICEPCYAT